MKAIKKILALVLVAMMAMGMVSALAEDPVTTFDIPVTQTMYFKNAEGSAVYEPNLYYTYTITPGNGGKTVKDHAGNQATVKAGDMRGFGLDTATGEKTFGINFSSDHKAVTAAADGKAAVTKKVTVQFDGSKLLADGKVTPGVYRYIITNTTRTDAKNAVGVIEEGTTDNTLVLDVYVKNDGTIGGAVIHDPETTDDPSVDNSNDPNGDHTNDDKDDKEGKTTGFGDPENTDDDFEEESPKDTTPNDTTKPAGDQQDPGTQKTKFSTPDELPAYRDMYVTYNVTVTKAVTGDMGDKSNFFPFQTDISNSIAGAAFTYSVTDNGTANVNATKAQLIATAGTKTLGSATATVADGFAIKNGGKINLIGVPSITSGTVSVLANEYNNTGDVYKTTALDFGIGTSDGTTITPATLAARTATTGNTAKSFKDNDANTTFTVTNNLDNVSPTGLVLRFAPYFAMFAAGVALFIILGIKRRKSEEE